MEEELYGAPWTLKEIINKLENKESEIITLDEKLNIILEHMNLVIQDKGEYIGVREMRKHICWYLKNLKDSSKIREKINKLEIKKEVEMELRKYFEKLKH